ncbi:unnamed protein product [Cochlearia groenlandica]
MEDIEGNHIQVSLPSSRASEPSWLFEGDVVLLYDFSAAPMDKETRNTQMGLCLYFDLATRLTRIGRMAPSTPVSHMPFMSISTCQADNPVRIAIGDAPKQLLTSKMQLIAPNRELSGSGDTLSCVARGKYALNIESVYDGLHKDFLVVVALHFWRVYHFPGGKLRISS